MIMPWIAKEQQTPARAFGALKVITNGRDGTLDLPNEAMMSVDRDRLGEHPDTHRYAVLRLTEQRDAPLLTLPMHKVVPRQRRVSVVGPQNFLHIESRGFQQAALFFAKVLILSNSFGAEE